MRFLYVGGLMVVMVCAGGLVILRAIMDVVAKYNIELMDVMVLLWLRVEGCDSSMLRVGGCNG